jgi:hypothetical protein
MRWKSKKKRKKEEKKLSWATALPSLVGLDWLDWIEANLRNSAIVLTIKLQLDSTVKKGFFFNGFEGVFFFF